MRLEYETKGKTEEDRSVIAEILLVTEDERKVRLRDAYQWSDAQRIMESLAEYEPTIVKPEMNAEEFQWLVDYNGEAFLQIFYPEWCTGFEKR